MIVLHILINIIINSTAYYSAAINNKNTINLNINISKDYKYTSMLKQNNPGNIVINSNINWIGEVNSNNKYVAFSNMSYGFRAMYKILISYNNNYGDNTINKIINRYSSKHDDNYKDFLVKKMNIDIDESINDDSDYRDLIYYMTIFENGYKECESKYNDVIHDMYKDIEYGIKLASYK